MVIKKGFTLAEIMIVLTVIGILTAVLLPTAIHSTPDANIMKFKKANTTLYRVISELVNSDKYYLDGDLGKKPDGSDVTTTYLCETFADVVSTKSVNCSEYEAEDKIFHIYWYKEIDFDTADTALDNACKTVEDAGIEEEIVTTDGVVYFQVSPAHTFASDISGIPKVFYYKQCKDLLNPTFIKNCNELGILSDAYTVYKPFCIDVDGIGKGEDPFGYGIRVDGKILPGKRAREWIQKSIKTKD